MADLDTLYGLYPYGRGFYGGGEGAETNVLLLSRYLPDVYFENGINTKKLLDDIIGQEMKVSSDYVVQLMLQRSVDDATWGLYTWEEEMGLNQSHLDTDTRRQRVKAKLVGRGTTTSKTIEDMGYSLFNAQVKVIEDYENFMIRVVIVGMKGRPENIDDFYLWLLDILPAHLKFELITTKMTWNEFEKYGYTFNEWDDKGLSWNEFEVYDERQLKRSEK